MLGQFRIIAISVSALWEFTSAGPADPTITTAAVLPRQESDSFIGYLEQNNTWTSLNCNPGLRWLESGQYAQCCPVTLPACYAATACAGGSQIYAYPDLSSVSTIACTENYNNAALSICNTILIYDHSQDPNPKTNINCGDQSRIWSYYRSVGTATESEEVSSSSSTPTTQVPSISVVPTPKPTEEDSGSKAWIAGAVVGPILGIALVGFGVWFCLRRKKKTKLAPQHGTASMAPIDPSQPPAGVGGYTDSKPQFASAQPTYYNQPGQADPYAQQGYPQQGGFSPPQGSPAPQYGFQQSAYNTTANSPPGTYMHDAKYEGGAAELGGDSSGAAPAPNSTSISQAAELSGADAKPHGEGVPDGK